MDWKKLIKAGVLDEIWDSVGELQDTLNESDDAVKTEELEKRIDYLLKHPDKQKPLGKISVKEVLENKRLDGYAMIKERIDKKIKDYEKI